MTDFTPIPGVTYRVTHFGRQRLATFTPQAPEDFAPWVDLDGDWFQLEGDDKILGVSFNPHPPTRTEWGTQDDEGSIVENHETDIEYALNETEQYDSQLMSRQVTEWNKAGIPDGWEKD